MEINVGIDRSKFQIIDGNNSFELFFLSAPMNFVSAEENGYFYFSPRKNINGTLWSDENEINIVLNKSVTYSSIFSLNINFDFVEIVDDKTINFNKNNTEYILTLKSCSAKLDDDGVFLISLNDSISSINVSKNNEFKAQSVSAFVAGDIVVSDNELIPEFSISSFDDSQFLKPRPIRQGMPVVSTVPSMIDSSSTQEEFDTYNSGKGLPYKTIYFRIICNSIIEPSLAVDAASNICMLKVYLPGGFDLVRAPIYKTMYLKLNDSTNNRSIYYASHTFYSQGNYNDIEYVDGLMYVDVDVSITVQQSLPLQFDFQI